MKITVVTVCRNAENCIGETIESVLLQEYDDYEYLVIDGASTDNTLNILQSFEGPFASKNIDFRYISEPDKGIYDAMNKSLDMADGEWILFMNAGDGFFDRDVLSNVFGNDHTGTDVIYGDILMKDNDHYKLEREGKPDDQTDHSPICHQAMFTRCDVLKEYRFDTGYTLAADYDTMIRMFRDGRRFKKLDEIISIFEMGGASYKQSVDYLKQIYISREKNSIVSTKNFRSEAIKLRTYMSVRNICRKCIGPVFYSDKRGWHCDKNSCK